jgi:excisionase family DNA binding protein
MKAKLRSGGAYCPPFESSTREVESETADINTTGRSMVYELIGNGTLPSLQIGKRRLVRRSAIRRLIAELECVRLAKAA